jgi:hypothetical protein
MEMQAATAALATPVAIRAGAMSVTKLVVKNPEKE